MSQHWFAAAACGAVLAAATGAAFAAPVSGTALLKEAQTLFKPLPATAATAAYPITPARVKLGRELFFDPRISLDGTVSCAKCHQPALYGTDALAVPLGVQSRPNPRNAPTVLNAALEFAAHWRGDRKNVEDQATKALLGHASYGLPSYAVAMARVKALPGYQAQFARAFPGEKDPVTAENWGRAIGAYERTLLTPAPFDAFLKGNVQALSPRAQVGLSTFMTTGCAACHHGVDVGGEMFQRFGIKEDYWKATDSKTIDKGRFDVTKNPADLYVFKVPSLRNVAMTPPYFHDGSVASLHDAVRIMARVQLGRKLDDRQVDDIVAFLGSLTGKLPADFARAPVLAPAAFRPVQ